MMIGARNEKNLMLKKEFNCLKKYVISNLFGITKGVFKYFKLLVILMIGL